MYRHRGKEANTVLDCVAIWNNAISQHPCQRHIEAVDIFGKRKLLNTPIAPTTFLLS